jgi:hypothetical protein
MRIEVNTVLSLDVREKRELKGCVIYAIGRKKGGKLNENG